MFSKVKAKGEGIHPVFAALTGPEVGEHAGDIRWNFTKFLVDREGRIIARFAPNVEPMAIREAIASNL